MQKELEGTHMQVPKNIKTQAETRWTHYKKVTVTRRNPLRIYTYPTVLVQVPHLDPKCLQNQVQNITKSLQNLQGNVWGKSVIRTLLGWTKMEMQF